MKILRRYTHTSESHHKIMARKNLLFEERTNITDAGQIRLNKFIRSSNLGDVSGYLRFSR